MHANYWGIDKSIVPSRAGIEEHYVATLVFLENTRRYRCLFKQGFGPLHKIMEYKNHQCLGLFSLELNRHRKTERKERYINVF